MTGFCFRHGLSLVFELIKLTVGFILKTPFFKRNNVNLSSENISRVPDLISFVALSPAVLNYFADEKKTTTCRAHFPSLHTIESSHFST